MKKIIVSGALCAFVVLGGAGVASAETTTATPKTQAEMLTQIQSLMKLIADLQAKLAQVKGEVEELTKDLALGAKDDDVLKAQEILASDPTLFGVKPTGYFGPMTEAALKKFQERYGLEVTGKLDEATRDVMKELRKERKNGMVPPGLVRSDEVKDRIKARLQERWDKKHSDDDMDDEDESDDDMDDDSDDMTPATREEARMALADTQADVAAYKVEVLKAQDEDEQEADEMTDTLREAQKKMGEARKKFARGKFSEVVEITDEVGSILDGSDDASDDDGDDSDDDGDDSDEDEDEEDEDDEDEDEDEDDDEDDDDGDDD